MKHKSFLWVLLLGLFMSAAPALAYGPAIDQPDFMVETGMPLTVHVDGRYVSTDVQPHIVNNRTVVPLRAVAESMQATVDWDADTRCINVEKNGNTAQFFIDECIYYVNGEAYISDVAPMITGSRTLLPLRAFAEALNADVEWNGTMADVQIYTGAPVQPAVKLPGDIPYEIQWLVQKYYVPAETNGTGSWYMPALTGVVGEGAGEQQYVFLSKMADGTQNAVTIDYCRETGGAYWALVRSCYIWNNGAQFTLQPYSGHGDWAPIYFQGPPMGILGEQSFHYQLKGPQLILTGNTYNFMEMTYYPNWLVYKLL